MAVSVYVAEVQLAGRYDPSPSVRLAYPDCIMFECLQQSSRKKTLARH